MLSIIVPIYNSEKYLDICLNSIKKQLFKEFEVILVDNNSTDNSVSICNKYIQNDSRFRLYEELSQGAAYCRNRGLREAKGDYITFVDSDDYLSEEAYMLLMKKMVDHDADMICFSFNYVDEGGSILNWQSPRLNRYLKKRNNFTGNDVARIFLLSEDVEGFCWNKIFKRKIFDDNQLKFETQKKAYEDMVIMFKAITCCKTIVFEPSRLYYYRQNLASLTHQNYDCKELEYLDSLNNIYDIASHISLKKEANVFFFSREIITKYDQCVHKGKKLELARDGFIKKLLIFFLNYKSKKMRMMAKGMVLYIKSIGRN